MIKHKVFSGRVNSDADLGVFPDGDLLNAKNVSYIVAQDGAITGVKPTPGNRRISDRAQPAGSYVIGSHEERELGRLYYFLYSPSGSHRILMFDQAEEEIKIVFAGEALGLGSSLITGVAKVGDILYWVQDDKAPKKINVERGLRTYNSDYVSPDGSIPEEYSNASAEDLELIRPYPAYAPQPFKQTLGLELNLIDTIACQFAFSFTYRDNETSVLSPYSKIINYNEEEEDYDSIRIVMDGRQQIGNEVDKVRLHVRVGNTGSFFIIKEWTRDANEADFLNHNSGAVLLGTNFNNDSNGVAVSEEYSAKLAESVPISSRALCAAKNRLFLGNNIFGYDKVTSGQIELTPTQGEIGSSGVFGQFVFALAVLIYTEDNSYAGYNESLFVRVDSLADEVNGYYDVTDILLPGRFFEGDLPPSVNLTPEMRIGSLATYDVDLNLVNFIAAKIPVYGAGYETTIIDSEVNRSYPGGGPSGDVQLYGLDGVPTTAVGGKSFKSGGRYRFGVVFYDFAGRSAGVYSPDDSIVSIPIRSYDDPASYPTITAGLTFSPDDIPEWATHYQLVRTKNLTHQSFIQGFGEQIQYVGKDENENWMFSNEDSSFFSSTFDDTKVQGIAVNLSPAISYGLGYSFLDGDTMRLWFADGSVYILPVIDTSGSYVICGAKDLGSLEQVGRQHFFELYTPRKGFLEETFYEIGIVNPVTAPGTPSRALSSTLIVVEGDIYIKERDVSGGVALVETMNPNDTYYKEWLTDIGRPNIILLDGSRSVRKSSVCYSNVWIASTEVNGLSSFDTLDYVDLDNDAGPVRSLNVTSRTQQYGSVLLAICEAETFSLYLGETRLIDNAGAAIIATSGDVIGTISNLRGGYGTLNPESVVEDDGRVYFADRINGVVVQYAQNGMLPISENAMANFFTENLYELDSGSEMPATVDRRTGEYLLYVPNEIPIANLPGYTDNIIDPHIPISGKVWRYHPEINGWTCAQDFHPKHMACVNRYVLSFSGAELYIHDSDAMEYYGTPFKSLVSFPVGSGDYTVKIPQNIGVLSSICPSWTHVKSTIPFEQGTDLVADEYTHTEAMFYASFLMDRLSPGMETYEHALLFGEPVRGVFLSMAVEFDQVFYMNAITVQYDVSRGHAMLQS